MADNNTKYNKRKKVTYEGRLIYEWEQSLEEIEIFIEAPPGIRAKQLDCNITVDHIKLGIKGNPPYIDERLGGKVSTDESYWTLEDGIIHISLQKATVGETWSCATFSRGNAALSEAEVQKEQQKILLERFQREHPGFDFSNAEFNGQAPDARKFLGGFDRTKI